MAAANVVDVDHAAFQEEVVAASHEQPVVVDFWASWCGPCKTLGPVLEAAVEERDGAVRLAKVDVDANGALAQEYQVRGIPAVKGFRDGQIVAQFTGAAGRQQVERFLDDLVPSAADRAAARGRRLEDEDPEAAAAAYREALDADDRHRDAAVGLARLHLDDDPERALELVGMHRPDPAAEAVAARAELALSDAGDLEELRRTVREHPTDGAARLLLGRSLAAESRFEEAVEHLLAAVEEGGESREPAREALVRLFKALGDDHELVRDARPKLARVLF